MISTVPRNPTLRPAIGTALILTIPLVMTFLDRAKPEGVGWHWDPGSFLVMGLLLFSAGLAYELVASRIDRKDGRVAVGIAVALCVFAIWVELAVDGVSKVIGLLFG